MTLGQRIALERIAGVLEGLASGVHDEEIQDHLITVVEQIEQLLLGDEQIEMDLEVSVDAAD